MNNFDFGEVLTRAGQIVWKHKVLWIFGILAGLARGNGGGSSGGGGGSGSGSNGSGAAPFSPAQIGKFTHFLQDNLWIILAVTAGLMLLFIILYMLGMLGRIALIKGANLADRGAEHLSFGELWAESLPFFWRILGLNVLVVMSFMLIIVPLILFGVVTMGIGFLCVLPLLCIIVPAGWVVMVVLEQAQAAIVLEDLDMLDGFTRGWGIVKDNAVTILIMVLILGIGSAVLGVILVMPLIIALVPIAAGMAALRNSLTPLYFGLVCCAAYFPFLLFFNGILTAYIQTAWTLVYLRLARQKKEAPVIIGADA